MTLYIIVVETCVRVEYDSECLKRSGKTAKNEMAAIQCYIIEVNEWKFALHVEFAFIKNIVHSSYILVPSIFLCKRGSQRKQELQWILL